MVFTFAGKCKFIAAIWKRPSSNLGICSVYHEEGAKLDKKNKKDVITVCRTRFLYFTNNSCKTLDKFRENVVSLFINSTSKAAFSPAFHNHSRCVHACVARSN